MNRTGDKRLLTCRCRVEAEQEAATAAAEKEGNLACCENGKYGETR